MITLTHDGRTYANWTAADLLAAGVPAAAIHAARLKEAERQVDDIHRALLAELTGRKPAEERDTWAPKEVAARGYLDGTASATDAAMIEAEAAGDVITGTELAQIVVAKADAFKALVGAAGAIKRQAKAALAAIPADAPGPQADIDAALTTMRTAAAALRQEQS